MSYHEWTLNTPLQEFFKRKNTKIVKDEDGMVGIELTYNNRVVVLSTKHIIKSFLRYLKSIAHEYFGKPICEIVITVPSYFSDLQRCHIKECCETVDLKVLRIINEPTAAALAYGFDTNREHFSTFVSENVLVIDCGGGTTDISILLMDYEEQIFEVKNVTGNNFLGGEDITDSLVTYVIQKMGLIADNLTPKQFNKLKNGCESLKLSKDC
jgi:molecular chaperone DnaK (HSP70)